MITLLTKPEKTVGSGYNVINSKWNAVHHPIVYSFQRSDFDVVSIVQGNPGKLVVSTSVSTTIGLNYNNRETVYIRSGNYDGVYYVSQNFGFSFEITAVYLGDAYGGFVNDDYIRRNYYLQVQPFTINYANNVYTPQALRRYYPDQRGVLLVDVSGVLQNIARLQNTFDYSTINSPEELMGGAFNIEYKEVYNGSNNSFTTFTPTTKAFYTNSAKQFLDVNGANMGVFVPASLNIARFLGPNCSYTYFPDFLFAIGFIYSEFMAGYQITREMDLFDQDGNLITHYSDAINTSQDHTQRINHLMIDESHDLSSAHSIKVWLQYDDAAVIANPYVAVTYLTPSDYVLASAETIGEPNNPTG